MINADGTPRVVFISGAAQGIGRASALRCASEGASVCISDLPAKEAEGKKLVEELKKVNSKGNHSYMNLNVVDEAQWEAAVKEIEKRYGRLDVLVNNAGVFFHEGVLVGVFGGCFGQEGLGREGSLTIGLGRLLKQEKSPRPPSKPSNKSNQSTSMVSSLRPSGASH